MAPALIIAHVVHDNSSSQRDMRDVQMLGDMRAATYGPKHSHSVCITTASMGGPPLLLLLPAVEAAHGELVMIDGMTHSAENFVHQSPPVSFALHPPP